MSVPKTTVRATLIAALLAVSGLASCSRDLLSPDGGAPIPAPGGGSTYLLQADRDGDGIEDAQDPCPTDPTNDDDGDGFCNTLLTDLDESGCVDLGDIATASAALAQQDLVMDLSGDGAVDLADVGIYAALYTLEANKCRFPRWTPPAQLTWQWQLTGTLDTTVPMQAIDVDLFDTSVETINQLHAQGVRVIANISVGTFETWRPDADQFPQEIIGEPYHGFVDEFWADIRSEAIRPIMEARMALAAAKGFDAVEPDNVDHYLSNNISGFNISESDQIDYLEFVAQVAHRYGLSVGLKNALELIPDVIHLYDWALNEECLDYDECDLLQPFLDAGKAVLHCEYVSSCSQVQARANAICDEPTIQGFSTLVKTTPLDACLGRCP